jgi:hypothetical protein
MSAKLFWRTLPLAPVRGEAGDEHHRQVNYQSELISAQFRRCELGSQADEIGAKREL